MVLRTGFHQIHKFREIYSFDDLLLDYMIFGEIMKFSKFLQKKEKRSPRAAVLSKSAQTLKNQRYSIPFGGLDSRRKYWNLSEL